MSTKSATVEELREYIEKKSANPDTMFYGIFLLDGDRHIGTIKLEPIDRVNKKAVLGILIGDKREWGKGYGPEAMRLLIDYCIEEGLMVGLGVLAQNEAAIRAYKRVGFEEVSRALGAVTYSNGTFDQVEMIFKKHA